MIKKILYVLLGLSLCFALTGCFDKEENENSKSRLSEFTSTIDEDKGIHIDYETTYEGNTTEIVECRKGDNVYTKTISQGSPTIYLLTGDVLYSLLPDTKFGTKRVPTEEEKEDEMKINYDVVEEYAEETEYKTGETKVEGKEYYYEEYTLDNGVKTRFFFDGKELKYKIDYKEDNKTVDMKIKYNTFDSDVDDSIFEVPSDYKIEDA